MKKLVKLLAGFADPTLEDFRVLDLLVTNLLFIWSGGVFLTHGKN